MKTRIFIALFLCSQSVLVGAQELEDGDYVVPTASSTSSYGSGGFGATDCVLFDYNGMQACSRSTDSAPTATYGTAQSAYAGAATNTTGADLKLAPGLGRRLFTVADYSQCSGDTVTVIVEAVSTTRTEGVNWTAATSNAATCSSLATTIEAITGVTATCSTASVYVQRDSNIGSVTLVTSDTNCITVTSGTDGTIRHYGNITHIVDSKGSTSVITGASADLTCAGGGSATLSTAANFIPDGVFVFGVTTRITTALTGSTGYTIGDGVDADLYGVASTATQGTTTTPVSATASVANPQLTDGLVRLTFSGGNCTAGVIRVVAHFLSMNAPTSN